MPDDWHFHWPSAFIGALCGLTVLILARIIVWFKDLD